MLARELANLNEARAVKRTLVLCWLAKTPLFAFGYIVCARKRR